MAASWPFPTFPVSDGFRWRVKILAIQEPGEIEEVIRVSMAARRTLEITGGGSKRAIGCPVGADAVLDLSALDRITLYEPEELVLTVQAGARLDAVAAVLAERNQELAFEPMDVSPLTGSSGSGTIGGMLSVGFAGPRRLKAGGPRDHFLGASAVSGHGETIKAGGRVVKNVTGYDMCKLLAGSWGTLAVMTEVTLKVMPRAESETTLVLSGLAEADAGRAMTAALGSPCDVSGAAHIPASALRGLGGRLGALDGRAATLLRVEGIAVSVASRADVLATTLSAFGAIERVEGVESAALWRAVRDVEPMALTGPLGAWAVWRIVCPPVAGCGLARELAGTCGGDALIDWGGGLVWLAVPPAPDAFASLVRGAAGAAGGHAMLFRAEETLRRQVPVFEPLPSGIAALNRGIKTNFDPLGILNPGRMGLEAGA
jgi:glycolate oxidase FAD binding subunit